MPLTLRWNGSTTRPVSGHSLRPDVLATVSGAEAARIDVAVGNGSAETGELFAIAGDASDGLLILEGDLSNVRGIGEGMTTGAITIRGDAGPGLGVRMKGGTIDVLGSVGPSAGSGMLGGVLRIRGNAGGNLGGSEPGARVGMREGVIFVEGDAGDDVGIGMRRGLIAVSGACGDGTGRGMIAGSVFGFGRIGRNPGLGMKRGTIVVYGANPRIGPTFARGGRERPPFLAIYLKKLREWGFPVPEEAFAGDVRRYNGDRAEAGQGEILVACRD